MKRRYKTHINHPRFRIPDCNTPEGKVYQVHRQVRLLCHKIYKKALKNKRLVHWRGKKCVDCGKPAQGYDHRNYYYPIRVDSVCQPCNAKRGEGFPYLGTQTEKNYREQTATMVIPLKELGH